ncbi:uncharacterized protein OCT59_001031 [Rhizophagus irregularis]|uniref:uncharacterized protein n=1 Tax=Rhizophagus irregularis TaxID=588596 RepID=UPI00331CBD3D|nr:hypothetical protein OCT59_001031 [Rhizophagus irregularis]
MYITHLISKNSFTILGFEFIVYHLGHHPEVVQRLRQEFDEVLEKNVTKPITHNDIDKLQYCDAVIKEVSRHFPVNYSLDRVNVEKDTIGGYVCSIMKRKDYWTDPEKFVSDGGIRACPGRKLAMIELKCLLTLIYRKYDIELADPNAPLNYILLYLHRLGILNLENIVGMLRTK